MEMSKELPFNLKVLSSTESSSSLNKISSFCRSGGRSVRIGSTVTSSKILFVLFKICKQQVTIISVNIRSLFLQCNLEFVNLIKEMRPKRRLKYNTN